MPHLLGLKLPDQELKMNTMSRVLATTMMLGVTMIALSGCPRQEGPAERAGKELDQALEKTGKQIEKAGDRVQDAAKGEKK